MLLSFVSYLILLNGLHFGNIIPRRRLRQGNPISLYLFIIGIQNLSRLLLLAKNNVGVHGIKRGRNALAISHLLCADDLIMLCQENLNEVNAIHQNLQIKLL